MNNYTCYHLHTDLSLLDSCTKARDYIARAKELGQTAIGFTEHGNIYSWVNKKMQCDEAGIKYLHGVEIYLTETLDENIRDNYHTILIARNYKGVKEINALIELSTRPDHFYYRPRISFEEFFALSVNVIKISACLSSPLNRYYNKVQEAQSKELTETLVKLCKTYDYYEIQLHTESTEQAEYNVRLYELSQKFNKPLIVGTDTHSLNKYKAECRTVLQKAKGIVFSNEDEFDLTYKTYNELVEMALEQNCLPQDVYLQAIENTNVMAESVEHFELDLSLKYPILYGTTEQDEAEFAKRVYKMAKEKMQNGTIEADKQYADNIKEEFRVFKKTNMNGYMLFMSELLCWCKENNIPIGFCRGSVGGSTIAYLTDVTDVDPIMWDTVFSRFCNEDRAEVGDIDVDISPTQRDLVYEYIIDRFGQDKTAYILALGTVSDKGCIDEIGRALNIPLQTVSNIKKEFEADADATRKKYADLFYYFDGIIDTVVSQSMHPAGIVASPITLADNYGVFWNKGKQIMCIDMNEIHEVGLVKYDILGLKNIEIIKDTCSLVGCKYPLSHEIDWNDKSVWQDMLCSNVGLFQFEGDYAFNLLSKFKPKRINDLSLVNASLRPSGASYRDRLISRQVNKNPSAEIDELLKDNQGFLVFQEDTIKFLQQICGLSGSEADNIRRAIGRKQKDRLEKALPQILEGYCGHSNKARSVAEQEAKEFLQIIEDSSDYQFNYNHSVGYSMIGYVCAYYRYYYPLEFVCAYLNNAKTMEDLQDGTKLAEIKGIQIYDIQFGKSRDLYNIDKKNNAIYKGIGSIKYLNNTCAEELYTLSQDILATITFPTLLEAVQSRTTVDKRQLDILVRLGYFSEYGGSHKLTEYIKYHNEYYGKKVIKKNSTHSHSVEMLQQYCQKETKSQFSQFDYKALLQNLWLDIADKELPLREKLLTQLEFLGYIVYTNNKLTNCYYVTDVTARPKSYLVDIYNLETGKITKCRCKNMSAFASNPLEKNDIINILNAREDYKWVYNESLNKCEKSNEKELVLVSWTKRII